MRKMQEYELKISVCSDVIVEEHCFLGCDVV
jgi:hypothetical protein